MQVEQERRVKGVLVDAIEQVKDLETKVSILERKGKIADDLFVKHFKGKFLNDQNGEVLEELAEINQKLKELE